MPLTDASPMDFGQFKDRALKDVPATYLLGLYDERKAPPLLAAYIKANLAVLKSEAKRASAGRVAQCAPRRMR